MAVIDDFLTECHSLIDKRMVDPFTNDPENKATLDMLGFSIRNLLFELKQLTNDDLFDGPLPDDNSKYPGEVWVFKKTIQTHLIYIKLKIRNVNGRKNLFVMSFHPDRPKRRNSNG